MQANAAMIEATSMSKCPSASTFWNWNRSASAVAVCLCLMLRVSPSLAKPDPEAAIRLFADAKTICSRDGGALWGKSICGPILFVDYMDQSVIANQADKNGVLVADKTFFRGTLPDEVLIANTPTEWSGTRWTQIVAPLPTETNVLHVLIAHELFHRIQPDLGLTRSETSNRHLDTFDGRYLLQLEWRALARALQAHSRDDKVSAVKDALAFRQERYRRFPEAAAMEANLEVGEGVPEYTGVKLGLTNDRDRFAFALFDLKRFVDAPTFVRSFAYATGPAYGLLLDEVDTHWRDKLRAGGRLDELLATALSIPDAVSSEPDQLAARYDDGALRASEQQRDAKRRARLAEFKSRLVDGPVLILPLDRSNYQFNPQTLVPLEGFGMIYPTMRLTDTWGSLEVDHGGALVREDPRQATVSAVHADMSSASGDGWKVTLKPGWSIQPGKRPGDLVVVQKMAPPPG
jgi:hypothetical protein